MHPHSVVEFHDFDVELDPLGSQCPRCFAPSSVKSDVQCLACHNVASLPLSDDLRAWELELRQLYVTVLECAQLFRATAGTPHYQRDTAVLLARLLAAHLLTSSSRPAADLQRVYATWQVANLDVAFRRDQMVQVAKLIAHVPGVCDILDG